MGEEIGHRRHPPALRQLVGIERDDDPRENGEQAKTTPGGDQRRDFAPRGRAARQPIDDAAEQQRLGEARESDRDIGAHQR